MAFMDKPLALRSMYNYMRKIKNNNYQVGMLIRCITLDYNNSCNFRCEFCYEKEDLKYNNVYLDFDTIAKVADEAYELGAFEIILQGGELLINTDSLIKLIKCLKPERFIVTLITNGYLLTDEIADMLKQAGLDCVGVSVSGMDEEEHDRSRRKKGSHKKVFEALESAKNAGLKTWVQPIFGHHNSKSSDLIRLLDYVKEKGHDIYFFFAMPFGVWEDNHLDADDMKIFKEILEKYGASHDMYDYYDKKRQRISGCTTMNRIFITPKGDVLPCPFINIKVGNVKEQSLAEIFEYGFSIRHFSKYTPICIAAQDKNFRKKYLSKENSMFNPLEAKDVFCKEDFVENQDK